MINYTSGMRTMSRSNFLARAGLIMEVTSLQTGGYELANSITKSTTGSTSFGVTFVVTTGASTRRVGSRAETLGQ